MAQSVWQTWDAFVVASKAPGDNACVTMSEIEYDFLYANSASTDTEPKKDLVITDGQVFTIGNKPFSFYITPTCLLLPLINFTDREK
ncbi:hypothetical protein K491DRAFT_699847 [Lophiostoma macrostomum CBS 122681]|uniref:Uncharacterized protein n=1 Tax=Lophiostoma macrostomum CBS 122681 TaxID=1314788 RepID=A0A6A6SJC5_9PLEO|nr:hypothetical protein K491DRAFT_699847 [Lophiostoma macrostomum CBS 122681]